MSDLAETYVRILVCGNEILRTNGRPQKLKLDLTKMKKDELTGSKLNKQIMHLNKMAGSFELLPADNSPCGITRYFVSEAPTVYA